MAVNGGQKRLLPHPAMSGLALTADMWTNAGFRRHGQLRTHPSQQMASLFDHFVGVCKDGLRDLRHLHCAVSSTRCLHCPQQKAIHGPITRRVDQQFMGSIFFVTEGGHRRLGRPFGVELRPRAVVRIAVKIPLRVARNAWHLVGFDALCVICVLPEPVLVPAPLHDWMQIVVS